VTLTSRNALQSRDSRMWEFATWVRETYVYDTDGFLAICATRKCVAAYCSWVTCIDIKLHISGKTKLNYLIILSRKGKYRSYLVPRCLRVEFF